MLLNDALYQAGNGVTDAIYNLLPEDNGEDPLDDCEDGDGNPADQAQQAAEWKVKVAQAAQAAHSRHTTYRLPFDQWRL